MRKLLLILVLLLLSSISFSAQESAPFLCSSISVAGPSGVVRPSDTIPFIVDLPNHAPSNLKYEWTITDGEIVKGQGSIAIDVQTTLRSYVHVIATVKITGLPQECSDTMSEEVSFYGEPIPIKLDETTDPIVKFTKARFVKIANELDANPNAQLCVTIEQDKSNSKTSLPQKIKIIKARFAEVGLDPTRITFKSAERPHDSFTFWLVPAGSSLPFEDQ